MPKYSFCCNVDTQPRCRLSLAPGSSKKRDPEGEVIRYGILYLGTKIPRNRSVKFSQIYQCNSAVICSEQENVKSSKSFGSEPCSSFLLYILRASRFKYR